MSFTFKSKVFHPVLELFTKVNKFCTSIPLLESLAIDPTSSTSSPYYLSQKSQEPNIDFELDVKVLINRGKCVLHTKDPAKEDELKL